MLSWRRFKKSSSNNEQRTDIKRLIVLLIENDIPIPEDLINSYIQKTKEPKSMSQSVVDDELPFY